MVATTKKTLEIVEAHNDVWRSSLLRETLRFAQQARGRRLRTRVEFAEQCVILPEGPAENFLWRKDFQPYAWHLLTLMDQSPFRRYRFTGCVQSGKTTNGPVINTLWHLFERRETVIYGIPQMDMARDKWQEELLPVIESSPELRQWLPQGGAGSKGGTPTTIRFRNGSTLRFMSAHGRDDKRSAFTAPVVVKTEVDRYDEAGEISREAPPVDQMEARTQAFGDRAFSYEECTVTTETGRIWLELQAGTCTALHYPCPHCDNLVRPLREHFLGVDDCKDVIQAKQVGAFYCPSCGEAWTPAQRHRMQDLGVPLDRGLRFERDAAGNWHRVGEPPPVDAMSFWWNAFDNRFWTVDHIAAEEWKALYSRKPDEKDLARRQFAWTLPSEPEEFDETPLTLAEVLDRGDVAHLIRGEVPEDTVYLSRGIDVRKTQLHFVVVAWTADGRGHVVDYGIMAVNSKELGVRKGVLTALRELRDKQTGYFTKCGQRFHISWTLVDGGWKAPIIRAFMRETQRKFPKGWMMVFGRGQSEPPGKGSYSHPQNTSKPGGRISWIGDDQCYVSFSPKYKLHAMFANSDEWKSFVHDGLTTPPGQPGCLTLLDPVTADEKALARKFASQLIAEKSVQRVVKNRGVVVVWIDESSRANHFLDCFYYACAAGHLCGVRVAVERAAPSPSQQPSFPAPTAEGSGFSHPDGRPFLSPNGD